MDQSDSFGAIRLNESVWSDDSKVIWSVVDLPPNCFTLYWY